MTESPLDLAVRGDRDRQPARAGGDAALRAYLVGAMHSSKAPPAVATSMSLLIALAAFEHTGAPVFLAFAATQILIGIGRFERVADFRARERKGLTAWDIAFCDAAYTFWAALFALTLGLTCYELSALAQSADSLTLSLTACTGFMMAVVTGSAGRPVMLGLQVVGLAAPQIYALLVLPVTHGLTYAAVLAGLVGAALAMGRFGYARIVALFRADEENRRLAHFDMLTGLKNRFAITRVFTRAIAEAKARPGGIFTVFLVDLDRFKEVNDTLGHAAGDDVIVEAARRLRVVAGDNVEVARMGGDEFLLLARGPRGVADAAALGQSLLGALARPFEVGGAAAHLGGSVGVALYPSHGHDMAELLRHADCALYEAKRDGRGRLRVFDDSLHRRLKDERALEIDLEQALREDQLEVWYQPIQSLGSGVLRGYEALARWPHPTRGLIPPDVFVPLAEQNGSIYRLGEIVLEKACREAARWDRRLSVAVNLSPLQFRRPEPLVETVREALARSGLEPTRLHLEITESFLLDDTPQTRNAVNELAGMGVKFSLDDFGAGYSSLAYIQNYPFSTIKIDRKFVENIDADRVSSAIVASVCVLAERIHVKVVAEGVETLAQSRALAELGVDLAQGYLYGRPARCVLPPPPVQLAATG